MLFSLQLFISTNFNLLLTVKPNHLSIVLPCRLQGWQSSVCNSTDGRTDGRNFRPRLVSSHDFWDERYFVRLFGRLQVELKYDRCSLWVSTNSIVSIRTATSKSTKNFGRCRVFSYFQYIILCVAGYIKEHPMDDKIPVTESRDMHESAPWTTRFLWQSHGICMKAHHGWYDSCDRITRIPYNMD